MKKVLFVLLCLFVFTSQALAGDLELRVQAMEETLKKQQKIIEEQQKIIQELKEQIGIQAAGEKQKVVTDSEMKKTAEITDQFGGIAPSVPPKTAASERDKQKSPDLAGWSGALQKETGKTGIFGGSALSNPNISFILNTYAYGSNLSDTELTNRNIPGFTTQGIDRRNGFNLDSGEIAIFAPVDPYFNLYATIPVTEDGAELEEAYFVTTSLPTGNQIKGGKFKSNFSRFNAQHSHVWDFVDQPLPYRAFFGFGDENLNEKGVQYTYVPQLPFYTIFGAELLQGDNEIMFGPDARSGPHAYTFFAKASLDLSDNATILFGPYAVTGSTNTSSVAPDSNFIGDSTLYGFEFLYKWRPSKYLGFKIQSEYLYRTQSGDLTDLTLTTSQHLDRNQDGFYIQGVLLKDRWEFGARYDILGLFKNEYKLGGANQDLGRKPWRTTAMVDYTFSEFALLRLQYTHDESDVNQKANNEFFLQAIFSIGAHPAHQF